MTSLLLQILSFYAANEKGNIHCYISWTNENSLVKKFIVQFRVPYANFRIRLTSCVDNYKGHRTYSGSFDRSIAPKLCQKTKDLEVDCVLRETKKTFTLDEDLNTIPGVLHGRHWSFGGNRNKKVPPVAVTVAAAPGLLGTDIMFGA